MEMVVIYVIGFMWKIMLMLLLVLEKGQVGRSYNISGENEYTNLELVKSLCKILDRLQPRCKGSYFELIDFVEDRPGHDLRYD